MKKMNVFKICLGIWLVGGFAGLLEAKLAWKCWQDAVEEAEKSHKILMVYFYEGGGGASDSMERESFAARPVIDKVEKAFVPVRIDSKSTREVYGYRGEELSGRELQDRMLHGLPASSALAFVGRGQDAPIEVIAGHLSSEKLSRLLTKVAQKHQLLLAGGKAPQFAPYMLAGRWKCSAGGTYILWHEHDNVISGYAEIPNGSHIPILARGHGTIEGDKMVMSWTNINGGKTRKGQATFKIASDKKLIWVEGEGDAFGGAPLERVPVRP